MSKEKNILSRIQHKSDIEENWLKANGFIPKDGELIIYKIDNQHLSPRIKIGDGLQSINNLPFLNDETKIDKEYVNNIFNTYILNIDYNTTLAFDTTQIIFDKITIDNTTTSILGKAILGQMVLSN